jgi:hypothetical protein
MSGSKKATKPAAANTVVPDGASVFQTKYEEFAKELLATFPELATELRAALALTPQDRVQRFQGSVKVTADSTANCGTVLPGVTLSDATWASLSPSNQKVIWEYVRLLTMCCFLEGFGADGAEGSNGPTKSFIDSVMGDWKEKLGKVDFEGLLGKFSKIFGFGDKDASGGSGFSGFKMPKLPERFLKGQLAKLAEEIVRDIKPEDLGLTAETMAECEKSPSRAFDLLVQVFTKNPEMIQGMIKKIGKRLQAKVQSGAIRPQEIAAEAEELMKEFAGNTDLVGMMESLKSAFGFEDMDTAKAAGREGSARLSAVRERLKKKLEAKKNAQNKK